LLTTGGMFSLLIIESTRFADDQGMVAITEMELRRIIDRLHEKTKKYSMKIMWIKL